MREKDVEKAVCDYAKRKYGAIAYKFTSPQRRSVPDRIIVFPGGVIVFIEFKAPGKVPTEMQEKEISRLKNRDQKILVCDNVEVGKQWLDSIMGWMA